MKKFISLFLATLISAACMPVHAAEAVFSFSMLKLPFEYRRSGSWLQIIESQEEWEQFYDDGERSQLSPGYEPQHTAPQIDFSQYMIVAGGLGGGTGPELAIDEVKESGDRLLVLALRIRPAADCNIAQVITYPTRAILIPRTDLEIVAGLRNVTYSCG